MANGTQTKSPGFGTSPVLFTAISTILGANLMILFVFIHMFSTFFTRAFVKPRELTWVTGFLLLAMAFAFGFTGFKGARGDNQLSGQVLFAGNFVMRANRLQRGLFGING